MEGRYWDPVVVKPGNRNGGLFAWMKVMVLKIEKVAKPGSMEVLSWGEDSPASRSTLAT